MENEISTAVLLRKAGEYEKALGILLKLHKRSPEDPLITYHCGWVYDNMGRGEDAVKYYEKAIEDGLEGEDLQEALLGLGSSFRTIGECEKSIQVLQKGMRDYPGDREFQVFLSLTLHDVGRHNEAIILLVRNLVETTSDERLLKFRKSLIYYSEKLVENIKK